MNFMLLRSPCGGVGGEIVKVFGAKCLIAFERYFVVFANVGGSKVQLSSSVNVSWDVIV